MNRQHLRAICFALLCFALASNCVRGQAQPPVRVYKSTDGFTAPVLAAPSFTLNAPADCQSPASGIVLLAAVIDTAGQPHNIQFVRPLGNEMDRLAVRIAAADRFSPAMHGNAAVAMGVTVAMTIEACDVATRDARGNTKFQLQLRAQPLQAVTSYDQFPDVVAFAPPDQDLAANPPRAFRVGGDVSTPVPFIQAQPIIVGNERDKTKYQGIVLISLIVDAHGLPQDLRVVRPLGMGLDQKALDAATDYRFVPALRARVQPVPVMITMEVNFRINCDIHASGCLK